MTTLEQRCRRLVKKWRAEADDYTSRHSADSFRYAAADLEEILPKRKAKKPREGIVYGPPPWSLVHRRKAKKGAKR
jgi:hypothetical protein